MTCPYRKKLSRISIFFQVAGFPADFTMTPTLEFPQISHFFFLIPLENPPFFNFWHAPGKFHLYSQQVGYGFFLKKSILYLIRC